MIYVIEDKNEAANIWSAPDIDSVFNKLNSSPAVNNKVLHEQVMAFELIHALGCLDDVDARAEGYGWLADIYNQNPDHVLSRSDLIKNGLFHIAPLDKRRILDKASNSYQGLSKVYYDEQSLLSAIQSGELQKWLSPEQINDVKTKLISKH